MPLTDDHVLGLMERVKGRFPIATDFGGREQAERPVRGLARGFLNMKEVFTPATENEIETYREVAYPKWIEGCERTLRDLHKILESREDRPAFYFTVVNVGTRPAKDALITIEAKGDCTIMPPDRENDDGDERNHKPLTLRSPPEPPPELFGGEIHFDRQRDAITGALECQIHAENLTEAALMRVPVRIQIRHEEAYATAEALVQGLVEGGRFGRLLG
jgi:hypothetical protein